MGLVLGDETLVRRVLEDFDYVIRNPINFHNTYVDAGSSCAFTQTIFFPSRKWRMLFRLWLVMFFVDNNHGDDDDCDEADISMLHPHL